MWVRKQQYPCQPICLVPKRCEKAICLPSPQIYTYPCQLDPPGRFGFHHDPRILLSLFPDNAAVELGVNLVPVLGQGIINMLLVGSVHRQENLRLPLVQPRDINGIEVSGLERPPPAPPSAPAYRLQARTPELRHQRAVEFRVTGVDVHGLSSGRGCPWTRLAWFNHRPEIGGKSVADPVSPHRNSVHIDGVAGMVSLAFSQARMLDGSW